MLTPSDQSMDGGSLTSVPSAMKVVLISESGTMENLWLPSSVGGRRRFPQRDDLPPIYMEAGRNGWSAQLGEGAVFSAESPAGENALDRRTLRHEGILRILWKQERFVLYSEAGTPEEGAFLPYYLEENTTYTIGRSEANHICYPNGSVSRSHAQLYWKGTNWWIRDLGSTNGTYVNGCRTLEQRLNNGDVVYILGLYILMGPGFVAMNNQNGRVVFHTPKIRAIMPTDGWSYAPCPERLPAQALFDRQPRGQRPPEPEEITFDMPPIPMTASKIPLLLRMGSPLVMGGRALVTGNFVMALTSLVFPGLTQGLTEKDRKEYEEKRLTVYRAYLAEKRQEIAEEKAAEEAQLNECYPVLDTVLRFALDRSRLWERRSIDDDFLDLRIGTGSRPLLAEKNCPKETFEVERDVLKEELFALAKEPVILENIPILLSLRRDHVVGVQGFSRETFPALRNLILQLVLTHSSDEVKLVILTGEEHAEEFRFARSLPHTWSDDRSVRFFAGEPGDIPALSRYLSEEIEAALSPDQQRPGMRRGPAYVIVAASKPLFDALECLKEVLAWREYCGVSIIAAFDGVPKECTQLIDLRGEPALSALSGSEESGIRPFHVEYCDPDLTRQALEELAKTRSAAQSQTYTLPSMITFLELYEVGRVEHLEPLRRWGENNPVKSLAVPIGVGTDGRIFTLDLHEKRQGPHGLVAGMTGSGKSEFIITYILSMAVNFSPDEVAFVLIDYKGGGLADAFENKERGIHLPHIVGTITNLDGDSIDRSLASIKSELTHRQTVFKEAKSLLGESTLDIYDYQKLYRAGRVAEPLPHLFIISDEFAELKQQQPMFMDELISAARIGRSLGVHLILATQKPGGVVNNQIWSNTKFRACLRVQDRSDSMEMLKRPEAAELKDTGRFYLQVGYDEYFALGQSAWCGADYYPQDQVLEEPDNAVEFLDNTGQPILTVKPETVKRPSQGRQITAIVQYLSNLAKEQNICPKKLWKDPLPKQLELEGLGEYTRDDYSVLLGTVDDPEHQSQFPLYLDLMSFRSLLVVGNAGTGKSTLLRTLLYGLVRSYGPDRLQYYLVDLSDGALTGYRHLPHCGAYLTERQTGELVRLMNLIQQIIAQRKALFAQEGVFTFEAFRAIRPLPLILFVIDGYTKMKGLEGGDRFFMQLPEYLREGAAVGIRYVVSCNHLPEVGTQSRQEFDGRIALQAKDHYEYADILKVSCKLSPPEINGRGMCAHEGRGLTYQAAMLDCRLQEKDQADALKRRLKEIEERDRDLPAAQRLPMLDPEQTYEDFCRDFAVGRIPLGYAARDMLPIALPLQQLYCLSIFFGNPKGAGPVFSNFLYAAQINSMETIVIRRSANSVMEDVSPREDLQFLECSRKGLTDLAGILVTAFQERCALRDEYSVQHGIPLSRKNRAVQASRYIRERSRPILVLIERFADLCEVEETKNEGELQGQFMALFSLMRGYNFYFVAGFYHTDPQLAKHPLMDCYNQEGLLLLSGGRYDKTPLQEIPYELKKFDKQDPNFNHFLLKYQESFHPLIMPCGGIKEEVLDPDEAPII